MLERDGVVGNRRFWLRDENGALYAGKRDGSMMRIRPEWDEATRRLALTFPDGERVDGVVELGEPVDAELYRLAARVAPRRRPVAGRDLALRRPAARRSSGPTTAPSTAAAAGRLGLARLARVARAPARGDGRRRRDRRAALPHAASRSTARPRTRRTSGWAGRCGSARRRSSSTATSAAASSPRAIPTAASSTCATLVTLAGYRREGREEPLPFGVYGAVVVPGRVRVGDIANPLSSAEWQPAAATS